MYINRIDECLKNVEHHWPQYQIDGTRNIWILKPGAKSRGRGKSNPFPVLHPSSFAFRNRRLRSSGRYLETLLVNLEQRREIRRSEIHRTPVAHSQHEIRHSSMVLGDRLESVDDLDVQRLLSSILHGTLQFRNTATERTSMQLFHSKALQKQFQSSQRSSRSVDFDRSMLGGVKVTVPSGEYVDQCRVHREVSPTESLS